MTIYHVAHRSDWEAALVAGEYRVSTRGRTLDEVGFIHASRADQVAQVAELFYGDDPEDLVVLAIDESAVTASETALRHEDIGNGQVFPHLYGPILPSFVSAITPATFIDGHFSFRAGA